MTDSQHPETPDCADFIERIVYYLDNELDEADVTEVRLHLDGCGPCLASYDLQRTVKAVLARSCTERAPEGLKARVLYAIHEVEIRITEGRYP